MLIGEIICLAEELVLKVMLGSTAWWLDCALKCMKRSGVHMVVRLCIEMHSLLCVIKYGWFQPSDGCCSTA